MSTIVGGWSLSNCLLLHSFHPFVKSATEAVTLGKTTMIATNTQMTMNALSPSDEGEKSPYPTVLMVTIMKQMESTMLSSCPKQKARLPMRQ